MRSLSGVDEPLLAFGSSTIIARIIADLDLPVKAISANVDPTRVAGFGRDVLDDGAFVGEDPLAEVLTGLDRAYCIGATARLTAPGNMPFVSHGLAAALAPPLASTASDGRMHHILALWLIGVHVALRDHLSGPGTRQAGRFAEAIGIRRVYFPPAAWGPFPT